MTTNKTASDRDEVLDAFLLENDHGRATLERYLQTYPQYAGALIDLSREAARLEAADDTPLTSVEQSRIDAAWITHKAAAPMAASDPLSEMTPEQSITIARTLVVPRQVVTCFRERKVDPASIPSTFLKRFADAVEISLERAQTLLAMPPQRSLARSFKADGKPGRTEKVSFEEILIDAGLSETECATLLTDQP